MEVKWNALPVFPVTKGVSAPFAGIHNGKLIVAGGCNFPETPVTEGGKKKYYSDLFVLDTEQLDTTAWIGGFSLPYTVAYGVSVSIPQGVVCIGGMNADTLLCRVTLVQWNKQQQKPEYHSWPDLPVPVDNAAAVSVNDYIYVIGGNRSGTPSSSVFRLHIPNPQKRWEECPSFPGSKRVQPVAGVAGKHIFLAGGFQPAKDGQAPDIPLDVLLYDTDKQCWKQANTLPVAQETPYCFIGGNALSYNHESVWCMGGVNYLRFLPALQREMQLQQATAVGDLSRLDELKQETRHYMTQPEDWYRFNNCLWEWNMNTRQWAIVGNYPQLARAGAGVVFYDDKLYVICGELKPGIRTPEVNYACIR